MKKLIIVVILTWFWNSVQIAQDYGISIEKELVGLENQLAESKENVIHRFAPNLFYQVDSLTKSLRKEFECSNSERELRKKISKAQKQLSQAIVIAEDSQKLFSEIAQKRKHMLQLSLVQTISNSQLSKAEAHYQQALRYGENRQQRKAKEELKTVDQLYNQAIRGAMKQIPLKNLQDGAEQVMSTARADAKLLMKAGQGDLTLKETQQISFLLKAKGNSLLPGFDDLFGVGGFNDRPPFPPINPPPTVSNQYKVKSKSANSIELEWFDRSDNEVGNRVMQLGSSAPWFTNIAELGDLDRFEKHTFQVNNLLPDTRYGFRLETYKEIDNMSYTPIKYAYTKDTFDIPVWRIQLKVRTADVQFADSDDNIRVWLNYGSAEGVSWNNTNLDYGRNDFERGHTDEFDLNLTGIERLGDISQIIIEKRGDKGKPYQDGGQWKTDEKFGIEEIELWVNGIRIFSRNYTSQGYLWLEGEQTETLIRHDELRQLNSWNSYIQSFQPPLYSGFLIPAIQYSFDQDSCSLTLSNVELISRIEGLVGHLINSELAEASLYWGDRHGPEYVESSFVDANTLAIDLDLKAEAPGFNPEVDIDFHLSFSVDCSNENELKLNVSLDNFEVDVDFDFWDYVLTLGISAIFELGANEAANAEICDLSISKDFVIPLDGEIGEFFPCDISGCPTVEFDEQGNLTIDF